MMKWLLGLAFGIAVLHAGNCQGQSLARSLMSEAWQRVQRRDIAVAEELLQDALKEARLAANETDLGECQAKLAWVELQLNQTPTAAALAGEAARFPLATADAGRVELVLASTATNSQEILKHLQKATQLWDANQTDRTLADMYLVAARIYCARGTPLEAYKASQKAAAAFRNVDSEGYGRSLLLMASAAVALNRLEDADKALSSLRSMFGGAGWPDASPLERTEFLCICAESSLRKGDLRTSYSFLAEARGELAKTKPPNDIAFAPVVLKQARVLAEQGNLTDAHRLVNWVIDRGSQLDQTDLAEALATRGQIYNEVGRGADADQDFRGAVDRYSSHWGDSHPQALRARIGLAKAATNLGQWDSAESELRAVIAPARDRSILGEAWRLFAEIKLMLGRTAAAVALATQALDHLDQADSVQPCELMSALLTLAATQLTAGNTEQATAAVDRASKLVDKVSESPIPWSAKLLELKGRLHTIQGHQEIAHEEFIRSLDLWNRSERPGTSFVPELIYPHREKSSDYIGLAIIGIAEGDLKSAEDHWKSAYTILSMAGNDTAVGFGIAAMADSYSHHDRRFVAAWLYSKSHELFARALGPEHSWTREIERRLALLNEKHLEKASAAAGMRPVRARD